jgi:hypothetical protein
MIKVSGVSAVWEELVSSLNLKARWIRSRTSGAHAKVGELRQEAARGSDPGT